MYEPTPEPSTVLSDGIPILACSACGHAAGVHRSEYYPHRCAGDAGGECKCDIGALRIYRDAAYYYMYHGAHREAV